MGWICPHCGTTATLQTGDVKMGWANVMIDTAPDSEGIAIYWHAEKCPNRKCGRYVLDIQTFFGKAEKQVYSNGTSRRTGDVKPDTDRKFGIGSVRIEPRVGMPLSSHIPAGVQQDYEEAYLIKDLSPKASATLCRRALQGLIRDFWKISKPTLHEELQAIQPQCDAALYEAMMSLKSIGNIGAHPEKNISVIVDIDEGEPEALLELIRILDKEWYVARSDRATRLGAVKALAQAKAAAKSPIAAASPAPQSGP